MKETCGNCAYFIRHYVKHRGEYVDLGVGHCKYPFEVFLAKGKTACADYTERLPYDEDIIPYLDDDDDEW